MLRQLLAGVCAFLLLTTGIYFRETIRGWFFALRQNLVSIEERTGVNLPGISSTTLEQVLAPAPLRNKQPPKQVVLTLAGTIGETNKQRTLNNLPAYKENSKLNAAALMKANDMFKRQYFEHESPTGEGPADLAKTAGYAYIMIGENLALGNYDGDADLVQAWMNSPGHRANILHQRFSEIGVAVVKGTFEGQETWIAVQEFGLPQSACPKPSSALNAELDSMKTQLDTMVKELEARRQELEQMRKRDPAYNQKVEEYNALAHQYNTLAENYKQKVANYNAQVTAFNTCAQSG